MYEFNLIDKSGYKPMNMLNNTIITGNETSEKRKLLTTNWPVRPSFPSIRFVTTGNAVIGGTALCKNKINRISEETAFLKK